ncbi:PTS sugar transporter subunit IIA [Agrococcus casei]|uniref:Ascorbate-specific PTS system EIIA component n=1 Tax=Agrococcus casei LMG 22410 TaxID=1255656 RepID=A0A1R4FDF3_9MICO|nr:PTS sugar transporter subunit IIA [Agrococcus casei]SJM53928.1 PTS system, IIA component [Agrococcus casei LMG 22410]
MSVTVATATYASGVYAPSWEEAVRAAGLDLVNAHAVGPAYIDEMLQIIDNYGPYCVVAPGVAVPHANASSLVRKDGVAVLALEEPVRFGHPHNDPVRLIVGIAATTAKRHITMLAGLAKSLDAPGVVNQIVAAGSRKEALELLGVKVRA